MSSDVDKFLELDKKHKELETKKIRLEEQHNSKREALKELVKEIQAEGYNPNKLKETIQEKEAQLSKEVKAFEEALNKTSEELSKIEA